MTASSVSSSSCSALTELAGEPLAGSAPHIAVWIGIEHPGAWGPKALTSLPEEISYSAIELASHKLINVLALRAPGRSLGDRVIRRKVFISFASLTHTWSVVREFDSDQEVATSLDALDVGGLTAGKILDWSPVDEPMVWICTNGKRDACCAVMGRKLVDDLLDDSDLWECSHIGGHRFAPTVLILPDGLILGNASAADVLHAVEGQPRAETIRGRSYLHPAAQAAQVAMLGDLPYSQLTTVDLTLTGSQATVTLNQVWEVHLEQVEHLQPSPASCNGEPDRRTCWLVTSSGKIVP